MGRVYISDKAEDYLIREAGYKNKTNPKEKANLRTVLDEILFEK